MPVRLSDAIAEIHLDTGDAVRRALWQREEATRGVVEQKEMDNNHKGAEKS